MQDMDTSVVALIGKSIPGIQVSKDNPTLQRLFAAAPLSKILADTDIHGIREGEAYKGSEFTGLTRSLGAKGTGLMNPLHCWWDREKNVLLAFGGTRRLMALKSMTQKAVSDGGMSADEPVETFVWYDLDRIKARRQAMTDNAFRRQFTDIERVNALTLMQTSGFTLPEMVEAIGLSKETINRYLSIANHPLLRELLFANEGGDGLPYSTLARLAAHADKHADWITEILLQWRNKARSERLGYKRKSDLNGKKYQDSKLKLSSYLANELVSSWIADLKAHKKPTGIVKSKKVNVEADGLRIKLDAIDLDLKKATAKALADTTIIVRMASKQLEAALAAKKAGQLESDEGDYRESEAYREEYRALMGADPDVIVSAVDDLPDGEPESSGDEQGADTDSPDSTAPEADGLPDGQPEPSGGAPGTEVDSPDGAEATDDDLPDGESESSGDDQGTDADSPDAAEPEDEQEA